MLELPTPMEQTLPAGYACRLASVQRITWISSFRPGTILYTLAKQASYHDVDKNGASCEQQLVP